MKRRNWNVLALKRAEEGYAPPDSPNIDLIYPAFHRPSSQDDRNDPNWRSKGESLSRDSPAAPKLNLNHLEKVEASVFSQKVVDWMIDPVATETANLVDNTTTIFGASSHGELKTLEIIVDAVTAISETPRDQPHHIRVVIDAAVDFQIVPCLARQPLHKATDCGLCTQALHLWLALRNLLGHVVVHLEKF